MQTLQNRVGSLLVAVLCENAGFLGTQFSQSLKVAPGFPEWKLTHPARSSSQWSSYSESTPLLMLPQHGLKNSGNPGTIHNPHCSWLLAPLCFNRRCPKHDHDKPLGPSGCPSVIRGVPHSVVFPLAISLPFRRLECLACLECPRRLDRVRRNKHSIPSRNQSIGADWNCEW